MHNINMFAIITTYSIIAGIACSSSEETTSTDDGQPDSGLTQAQDSGIGSDGINEIDEINEINEDAGFGDSSMLGGCDNFPAIFGEMGAFVFEDPNYGSIVRYTEFHGLQEGHAYAESIFDLTLFQEFGAQFAPATIELSGPESDFATCAYCLRFSQNVSMTNGNVSGFDHMFMPQSGRLVIEEITPKSGKLFKFSIDAQMVEVDFTDDGNTIPVANGCRFHLSEFERTAVLRD